MRAKPLRPSFYCLVNCERSYPVNGKYIIYKVVPDSNNELNDNVYYRYFSKDDWYLADKPYNEVFPDFIKGRGHTIIAESNCLSDLESLRDSLQELIG